MGIPSGLVTGQVLIAALLKFADMGLLIGDNIVQTLQFASIR